MVPVQYILSLIIFTPLIGVFLLLLPVKWGDRMIKNIAIIVSLVPFVLACILWWNYSFFKTPEGAPSGAMQFTEYLPWIPQLNINYFVGADGISVPMIFLTTLLTVKNCLIGSRAEPW